MDRPGLWELRAVAMRGWAAAHCSHDYPTPCWWALEGLRSSVGACLVKRMMLACCMGSMDTVRLAMHFN
jgi:hypothetical protein